MKLIGLTGKAGAGKDTVADYLVDIFGATKLSMAGPLKAGLAAMGLPEPADRAAKEQPVPGFDFTWREAAQKLGTEFGRALDEQIWIKLVDLKLSKIEALDRASGSNTLVVISDIRFDNEAALVRRLGQVWHISGRQADLGGNAKHASEAGILFDPAQDEVIDNRGTLIELHNQIDCLIEGMTQ